MQTNVKIGQTGTSFPKNLVRFTAHLHGATDGQTLAATRPPPFKAIPRFAGSSGRRMTRRLWGINRTGEGHTCSARWNGREEEDNLRQLKTNRKQKTLHEQHFSLLFALEFL